MKKISRELKKNLLKQLAYRATHRGMKELDVVLGEFVLHHLNRMSCAEITEFTILLEREDNVLFEGLFMEEGIPEDANSQLFVILREYVEIFHGKRTSNI